MAKDLETFKQNLIDLLDTETRWAIEQRTCVGCRPDCKSCFARGTAKLALIVAIRDFVEESC